MAEGKSILEQLLEEAADKGKQAAEAGDFAVNLSTTDSEGTHTIEGIPVSKVGKSFLARFGITSGDDDAADAGKDDKGEGDKGEGDKGGNPIRYFGGGGKRAS